MSKVKTVRGPNPLTWIVPLSLVILVGAIWVSYLVFSPDDEEAPTPTAPIEVTEEPVVGSDRPQPPRDEHREELALSAQALLNEAKDIAGQPNASETLREVAQGDESSLPASFTSQFRIIDVLADDEEIRAAALIAVLQLGQVLDRTFPEGQDVELLRPDAPSFVYLDLEAGNAHVPLSLFLGPDAAFSFEYVWVNDRWVFSPYSFIDAVSAADIAASRSREAQS